MYDHIIKDRIIIHFRVSEIAPFLRHCARARVFTATLLDAPHVSRSQRDEWLGD